MLSNMNSRGANAEDSQPEAKSEDQKPDFLTQDPYQHTKEVLNAINETRLRYQKFLEYSLIPEAYEAIIQGKKDQSNRYIISPNENKVLSFYKKLFNLFNDAYKFILSWEEIDKDINAFNAIRDQSSSAVKVLKAIWWACSLPIRYCRKEIRIKDSVIGHWSEFAKNYSEISKSTSELQFYKVIASVPALTSLSAILSMFNDIINQVESFSDIQDRLASNAIWSAYKSASDECNNLIAQHMGLNIKINKRGILAALAEKVITLQKLIDMVVTNLAGTQTSSLSLDSYGHCKKALNDINEVINIFAVSEQKWPDWVKLINSLRPAVLKLLKYFPQSCTALKKVLNAHLLEVAQQINLLLRDCFLGLDFLEIKFFLKEGFLNSLGQPELKEEERLLINFAGNFNAWVESYGWKFKEEERYPYKQAILRQRRRLAERILSNNEQTTASQQMTPPLEKDLLEKIFKKSCESGEKALQAYRSSIAREDEAQSEAIFIQQKNAIKCIIEARIAELKKELNNAWLEPSKTKQQKIDLLNLVKRMIDKPCNKPIKLQSLYNQEKVLKCLSGQLADPGLLFQGRTGKAMEKIRYLSAGREDSISLINNVLEKLQQTEKRGFWFFTKTRARWLRERVDALKKLREWLNKPGYRLDDALEKLRVKYSSVYNVLYKRDYKIINELKRIEQHLSDYHIGKKILDRIKIPNKELLGKKQNIINQRIEEIDNKIEEISKSKAYWFPQWHIDTLGAHKKALKLLQQWLQKPRYELEDVLRVFELKYKDEHYYLMREQGVLKEIASLESPNVYKGTTLTNEIRTFLERLDLALDEKELPDKIQHAARAVSKEGEQLRANLDNTIFSSDKGKKALVESLKCALHVVEHPTDQAAILALRKNARENARGRPSFWKEFIGALGLLAVAAIACLTLAGIPLVAGLSTTAYAAGATALSVASLGFFYYGSQKGLSKKLENLADSAGAEQNAERNPGVSRPVELNNRSQLRWTGQIL